jgi:16S rRNA (guanine966-N2)-methyltransferase
MSNPRIIAGSARGIRIKDVPGDTTRPITDRVKENLFNIIGMDVVHSTWLDLFAGTGSVGLEALSRGADFVQFLDKERLAVNTIKSNLLTTRLSEHAQVQLTDAFAYLKSRSSRRFDYVYIAPPQYHDLWQKALTELDLHPELLSEDGWAIVQIDPVEYVEMKLAHFSEFDQRRYGSTLLVFYR